MKKLLMIILIFFLSMNIVLAKENKLVISSSDNKLYYDSKLFDEAKFMSHLDMIPGSQYSDNLEIENETNYTFNLYLKVTNGNNNELINYLTMKLYLDGNLIYDGDMKEKQIINENSVLNNAILLGNFNPHQISNLVVTTEFSKEYSNTANNESLITTWTFYAETFDDFNKPDEPNVPNETEIIEIVPAPITGINKNMLPIIISAGSLCVAGVMIIIILAKRKNKDDKYEEQN